MKKTFVALLLIISSIRLHSQDVVPYIVQDSLLCWDKKGAKTLYKNSVKASYFDSLNTVNDSIFKLYQKEQEKNAVLREKNKKKNTNYLLILLVGFVLGTQL